MQKKILFVLPVALAALSIAAPSLGQERGQAVGRPGAQGRISPQQGRISSPRSQISSPRSRISPHRGQMSLEQGRMPFEQGRRFHEQGRFPEQRGEFRDRDRGLHGQRGPWHGDIRQFHDHDFFRWRSGHWSRGVHNNRVGWWWVTNGLWYYYSSPIFPYPNPFIPSGIAVSPSALGQTYYYCDNPAGYYPYVPRCNGAWRNDSGDQAIPSLPPSQSDADYQQLHAFGDELNRTDMNSPYAPDRLRDLELRVDAFRQGLYDRGYNAASLLKETEDLQDRIRAQRKSYSPPYP